MKTVRPNVPQVHSIKEAREFIEQLVDSITAYGRLLGAVQPALEHRPDLQEQVRKLLNP